MTLYVETLSHGEIESGFFASFTQYARLGDYAFSTYLAQGGFLGWKDPPDYSKPTLEAIKKSSNPLFKKA